MSPARLIWSQSGLLVLVASAKAKNRMRIFTVIFLFLSLLASAADPLRVDIQMDQKEIYVNMPASFTITIFNDSDQPVTVCRPMNLVGMFGFCCAMSLNIEHPLRNQEKSRLIYPWINDRHAYRYHTIAAIKKYPEYYLTVPARGKIRTKMYAGLNLITREKGYERVPAFDVPGTYKLNVRYSPFRGDPLVLKRPETDKKIVIAQSFTFEVKDVSEKDKVCWKKLAERRDWFRIYDAYGANYNTDFMRIVIPSEVVNDWGELAKSHPDSVYYPLMEYQWFLMNARARSSEEASFDFSEAEPRSRLPALAADPNFIFREPASAYVKLIGKHKRLPLPLNFFAPPFVEPTAAEIAAEKRRLAFWVAGLAGSAFLLGWGSFRLWWWWKSRPKVVATMRPKSMKFGKAGCWLAFLPWLLLFCCCYWEVDEDISFYFFLIGPLMAFILAIVGLFKDQPRKYAIAALILSSISLWLIWGYMRIMYRFL
jgi:hypothetical protein